MQGRVPHGMMVAFLDCDTNDWQAANDWYNNEHIPEVTSSELFCNATRYAAAGTLTDDQQPDLMTLYETNATDLIAAYGQLVATMHAKPLHEALTLRHFGMLERVGVHIAPTNRDTKGVLVGITDCKDDGRDEEYQQWYDRVHAADVIKSEVFWGRQRYRAIGNHTLDAAYFAFYESDQSEPNATQTYLNWPHRDASIHELMDIRHIWQYNLIYSQRDANLPTTVGG